MNLEFLRLESLKLAYEMAYKLGYFSSPHYYKNNFSLLEEDIEDVFKIADINMGYLVKSGYLEEIDPISTFNREAEED